ncbi:MAG: hypothetical protein AB1442_06280 [Nitrospirota bacterium]
MRTTTRYLTVLLLILFLFGSFHVFAEETLEPKKEPVAATDPERQKIEEKWGIQIKSVRLSAAGYMVDFRYHVTDSDKASAILRRQQKAALIDQDSGTELGVPRTRLGPMRQTAVKPAADRDYFIFFGNKNGVVKPGDKVTVVIGDFKLENLVVEE